MIILGGFFIMITAIGLILNLHSKLKETKWNDLYMKIFPFLIPLPIIAIEFGWILAEVGRQPWVVYRVLKTADGFSTNVPAGEILFSIIAFSLVYILLASLFLFVLKKIVKKGPEYVAIEEV
jgi:cytochrome d ubiquinol oxidase subunit I